MNTVRVNAPPELQPWIRKVEERLNIVERLSTQQGGVLTGLRQAPRAAYAEVLTEVAAPVGLTTGWVLMAADQGPTVQVTTDTGLIKVTLSAYMTAVPSASTTLSANGAMVVSLGQPMDPAADLATEVQRGLFNSFVLITGQPSVGVKSGSYVRVLQAPPGTYTLRTEYLYYNVTDGVNIKWAQRSILAEPI